MISLPAEPCIHILTEEGWNELIADMRRLNKYNVEHTKLMRHFIGGSEQVGLDKTNRLHVPKRMIMERSIEKEVVVVGVMDRIEIWALEVYNKVNRLSPEELLELTTKHLGGQQPDSGNSSEAT